MAGVAQAYQHLLTIDCLLFSGVLADLKPVQIWTPGSNPLALPKCFKTEQSTVKASLFVL